MGFTLLMFAGELASVLGVGELGSASIDPPLRRACLESIAAATLNAAGIWTVGGSSLFQLDPGDGSVRFSATIGEPAHFATPAASDGRVFVAAGGHVYAFG